jgi:hypothetical protein
LYTKETRQTPIEGTVLLYIQVDASDKAYLDHVRATARPKLQQAIDRIWQRILEEDH